MANKKHDSDNPGTDTTDKKLINAVINELRPLIDEAIDVKIQRAVEPISTKIESLQKTLTQEIKNITANMKAPPLAGNMDLGSIMNGLKDDPQLKGIMNMVQGGGTPQAFAPVDTSKMTDEEKKQYQTMQSVQMLGSLLQSLGPMLGIGQGNSSMWNEMMMRKMMSDMAFAEHSNRAMMQFMMKKFITDPDAYQSYMSASDKYMSPIADPAKFAPKPEVKQE